MFFCLLKIYIKSINSHFWLAAQPLQFGYFSNGSALRVSFQRVYMGKDREVDGIQLNANKEDTQDKSDKLMW